MEERIPAPGRADSQKIDEKIAFGRFSLLGLTLGTIVVENIVSA
jgi:hypothetical protein